MQKSSSPPQSAPRKSGVTSPSAKSGATPQAHPIEAAPPPPPTLIDTLRHEIADVEGGEAFVARIVRQTVEQAGDMYLDRHYNALAVEYTALSLWDEMLCCTELALVTQDRGMQQEKPQAPLETLHARAASSAQPSATSGPSLDGSQWAADHIARPVSPDAQVRSFISLREQPRESSLTSETSKQLLRLKVPHRKSRPAGEARPDSSGAGSQSTTMQNTSRYPRALGATKRLGGSSEASPRGDTGTALSTEASPRGPAAPTADEQLVAEELELQAKRRQDALDTQQRLSQQLQDAKLGQRGFIVDSTRVVPLVPPEQILSSFQKSEQQLRFALPPQGGAAPAEVAKKGGTKKGWTSTTARSLGASRNTTDAQAQPRRKETDFYVPETTSTTMVISVAPSGGVAVRDENGGQKKSEFVPPKSKSSRSDFLRAMSMQLGTFNANGSVEEHPLEQTQTQQQMQQPSRRKSSQLPLPPRAQDGADKSKKQQPPVVTKLILSEAQLRRSRDDEHASATLPTQPRPPRGTSPPRARPNQHRHAATPRMSDRESKLLALSGHEFDIEASEAQTARPTATPSGDTVTFNPSQTARAPRSAALLLSVTPRGAKELHRHDTRVSVQPNGQGLLSAEGGDDAY